MKITNKKDHLIIFRWPSPFIMNNQKLGYLMNSKLNHFTTTFIRKLY